MKPFPSGGGRRHGHATTGDRSQSKPHQTGSDGDSEVHSTLVADGLRKRYGDTVALDGVSLSVDRGEILALVGPNGAGKTTTVRVLTGTLEPDAGTVELFGADPAAIPTEAVGLLPQAFSPQGRLTPLEIVQYYAGLYSEARDPRTVLADVGIDPDTTTWYESLSGGQQRRVAVATTLVNDPEMVFLDEPTTSVDPAGRQRLWSLLESINESGTTIVLTTHDMREAERLADRVVLLAKGSVLARGTPASLVAKYGGERHVIVETTARPDTLGTFEVTPWNGGIRVDDVSPDDIAAVVRELDAGDISFAELTWREPTLEDAYLELVDDESVSSTAGRP